MNLDIKASKFPQKFTQSQLTRFFKFNFTVIITHRLGILQKLIGQHYYDVVKIVKKLIRNLPAAQLPISISAISFYHYITLYKVVLKACHNDTTTTTLQSICGYSRLAYKDGVALVRGFALKYKVTPFSCFIYVHLKCTQNFRQLFWVRVRCTYIYIYCRINQLYVRCIHK